MCKPCNLSVFTFKKININNKFCIKIKQINKFMFPCGRVGF